MTITEKDLRAAVESYADVFADTSKPHLDAFDVIAKKAAAHDALVTERDEARRTAEYWKSEHLSGNAEIDRLKNTIARLRAMAEVERSTAEEVFHLGFEEGKYTPNAAPRQPSEPLREWQDGVGLLWDVLSHGKRVKRVVSPIGWDAWSVHKYMVGAHYAPHINVELVRGPDASPDATASAAPALTSEPAEEPKFDRQWHLIVALVRCTLATRSEAAAHQVSRLADYYGRSDKGDTLRKMLAAKSSPTTKLIASSAAELTDAVIVEAFRPYHCTHPGNTDWFEIPYRALVDTVYSLFVSAPLPNAARDVVALVEAIDSLPIPEFGLRVSNPELFERGFNAGLNAAIIEVQRASTPNIDSAKEGA